MRTAVQDDGYVSVSGFTLTSRLMMLDAGLVGDKYAIISQSSRINLKFARSIVSNFS